MRFTPTTVLLWGAFPLTATSFVLSTRYLGTRQPNHLAPSNVFSKTSKTLRSNFRYGASTTDSSNNEPSLAASNSLNENELALTDSELASVKNLYDQSQSSDSSLQEVVAGVLPKMHPSLLMKLRRLQTRPEETVKEVTEVANALSEVLDQRLSAGRDLLEELLECGEIRKLDSAIGKAAREGRLDMGFFTVITMNLQEAAATGSEDTTDENKASRMQILQHVYTRCQEEVEKTVPPGVALLNKLMRTDQQPIRQNQYQHYLCPSPSTITSPDGTVVELGTPTKPLVAPSEFVEAIRTAVLQIRTTEKAGGISPEGAANFVESVRQVAKEARLVLAEHYGLDSSVFLDFQDGLQPIFRPESPTSPYIQGEQQ